MSKYNSGSFSNSNMQNYHLTKNDDQWKLTKEHGERATFVADKKADVLQKSIGFMNEHGGSLKIHKEDGTIQEERTYPRAADPRQSPG